MWHTNYLLIVTWLLNKWIPLILKKMSSASKFPVLYLYITDNFLSKSTFHFNMPFFQRWNYLQFLLLCCQSANRFKSRSLCTEVLINVMAPRSNSLEQEGNETFNIFCIELWISYVQKGTTNVTPHHQHTLEAPILKFISLFFNPHVNWETLVKLYYSISILICYFFS